MTNLPVDAVLAAAAFWRRWEDTTLRAGELEAASDCGELARSFETQICEYCDLRADAHGERQVRICSRARALLMEHARRGL